MLSRRGARVVHGPTMTTELLDDLDATIEATRRVLADAHRHRRADDRDRRAVVVRRGRERRHGRRPARTRSARGRGRRPRAEGAVGGAGRRARRRVDGADRDERRGARPPRRRRASPAGASSCSATAASRCSPTRSPTSAAADVVDVPVYRWNMPEDADAGAPAARGGDRPPARRGDVHVLLRRAQRVRAHAATPPALAAAFDDDVLAVAVGPVTADALRAARGQPGRRAGPGPPRLDGPRPRRLRSRSGPVSTRWRRRRWQGTVDDPTAPRSS